MEDNKYTKHVYDAINSHVNEVFVREKQLSRLKRAKANRAHFKNIAILLISLGVFFLMASFSYRLLFFEECDDVLPEESNSSISPVQTKQIEENVNRPAVDSDNILDPSANNILDPSANDAPAVNEKIVVIEKQVLVPVKIESDSGEIEEFTIFSKKVPNPKIDGVEEVITGKTFHSSLDKLPYSQWCYTTNSRNNVSSAQVKLATKDGAGSVKWLNVTNDDATAYGATVKNLEAAKDSCSFSFAEPPRDIPLPEDIPVDALLVGNGTSFFVNKDAYAVTNYHVVQNCSAVVGYYEGRKLSMELAYSDAGKDIAILQANNFDAVSYAIFSDSVGSGQDVAAFGFPLGDRLGKDIKITKGNISAMTGLDGDDDYLQFTAPVQPGNSGGPLLDNSGHVVGVNTAALQGAQYQNINFAIKGAVVQSYLARVGVGFEVAGYKELSTEELIALSNKFTFAIECY